MNTALLPLRTFWNRSCLSTPPPPGAHSQAAPNLNFLSANLQVPWNRPAPDLGAQTAHRSSGSCLSGCFCGSCRGRLRPPRSVTGVAVASLMPPSSGRTISEQRSRRTGAGTASVLRPRCGSHTACLTRSAGEDESHGRPRCGGAVFHLPQRHVHLVGCKQRGHRSDSRISREHDSHLPRTGR